MRVLLLHSLLNDCDRFVSHLRQDWQFLTTSDLLVEALIYIFAPCSYSSSYPHSYGDFSPPTPFSIPIHSPAQRYLLRIG